MRRHYRSTSIDYDKSYSRQPQNLSTRIREKGQPRLSDIFRSEVKHVECKESKKKKIRSSKSRIKKTKKGKRKRHSKLSEAKNISESPICDWVAVDEIVTSENLKEIDKRSLKELEEKRQSLLKACMKSVPRSSDMDYDDRIQTFRTEHESLSKNNRSSRKRAYSDIGEDGLLPDREKHSKVVASDLTNARKSGSGLAIEKSRLMDNCIIKRTEEFEKAWLSEVATAASEIKITKNVSRCSSLEPGEIDDQTSVTSDGESPKKIMEPLRTVSLLQDREKHGDKDPLQICIKVQTTKPMRWSMLKGTWTLVLF